MDIVFYPTCLRSLVHKVLTNCKQQYYSRSHSDSVCKFCLWAKQLSQSSDWLLFFINPILKDISGVIQPGTAFSLTSETKFSKSTTRQHQTPFNLHQSLVRLTFSVLSILNRGYRKRQRFKCGDTAQQFKSEDENTEKGPSTSCCDFQCHESWHRKSFICTLQGGHKDTLLIVLNIYAPQITYGRSRFFYNIIDIVRENSENNKSKPH